MGIYSLIVGLCTFVQLTLAEAKHGIDSCAQSAFRHLFGFEPACYVATGLLIVLHMLTAPYACGLTLSREQLMCLIPSCL